VRTFAPIVAGVGQMNYRRFLAFNLIGGVLWAIGVTLAGYFLAAIIGPENIDKYLLPIIILIVAVSIAPSAYHVLREKENRAAIRSGISKLLGRSAPAVE
jgi:membrane-associated protein